MRRGEEKYSICVFLIRAHLSRQWLSCPCCQGCGQLMRLWALGNPFSSPNEAGWLEGWGVLPGAGGLSWLPPDPAAPSPLPRQPGGPGWVSQGRGGLGTWLSGPSSYLEMSPARRWRRSRLGSGQGLQSQALPSSGQILSGHQPTWSVNTIPYAKALAAEPCSRLGGSLCWETGGPLGDAGEAGAWPGRKVRRRGPSSLLHRALLKSLAHSPCPRLCPTPHPSQTVPRAGPFLSDL